MINSYSLARFEDIGIDPILLRNQIRTYQKDLALNVTILSEYSMIEEWIEDMVSWKFYNLNHSVERAKIGIYGELFATALLAKEEYFRNWIATIAIQGFGDNTNRDIKSFWVDLPECDVDIEIKTMNRLRAKAILEHKVTKKKPFSYPECLVIVREIEDNTYKIHSATFKNKLQKISKIKSSSNTITYEFNLSDLNEL